MLRLEELLSREHTCSRMPWNPHTQDTARRLQGQDQAGLHSETLSQSKPNQNYKVKQNSQKRAHRGHPDLKSTWYRIGGLIPPGWGWGHKEKNRKCELGGRCKSDVPVAQVQVTWHGLYYPGSDFFPSPSELNINYSRNRALRQLFVENEMARGAGATVPALCAHCLK